MEFTQTIEPESPPCPACHRGALRREVEPDPSLRSASRFSSSRIPPSSQASLQSTRTLCIWPRPVSVGRASDANPGAADMQAHGRRQQSNHSEGGDHAPFSARHSTSNPMASRTGSIRRRHARQLYNHVRLGRPRLDRLHRRGHRLQNVSVGQIANGYGGGCGHHRGGEHRKSVFCRQFRVCVRFGAVKRAIAAGFENLWRDVNPYMNAAGNGFSSSSTWPFIILITDGVDNNQTYAPFTG